MSLKCRFGNLLSSMRPLLYLYLLFFRLTESQGFLLGNGLLQEPRGRRVPITALLEKRNNGYGAGLNGFPSDDANSIPSKSKSDLYSNEELQNLLNLHQSLSRNGGFVPENSSFADRANADDGPVPLGLHDMVLQTLEDLDTSNSAQFTTEITSYCVSDEMKTVLSGIRAIASDVDGTLISSDQTIHPTTKEAVKKAVEQVLCSESSLRHFFPATGKTRAAVQSLGPELAPLLKSCPGVFVQGLYCVNAEGEVIYEEKLEEVGADAVIEFAESEGLSVFGYDGDDIFTTSKANPRHVREFSEVWGEPTPIIIESLLGYQANFHKVLVWSDDTNSINNVVRPQLEKLAADNNGSVTQAIPTMLEILPKGASKARGVQKLCEYLGISMQEELLAIGDAENDMAFLQESAFGVAVGNAVPKVKEVADFVLDETNDEGGAGIAIKLFGLGEALR